MDTKEKQKRLKELGVNPMMILIWAQMLVEGAQGGEKRGDGWMILESAIRYLHKNELEQVTSKKLNQGVRVTGMEIKEA